MDSQETPGLHQRAIGKTKAKCKYSQRHVNRTQQAQADTLKTSAVAEDHGTKPCKSSKKAQNQRSAGVNTIPSYTALNIPPLGNSALRREERDLSRKPVVQTECPPQMSSPPLFSQCCRVAKLPIRPTTADNSAESPVQATQKTPLSLAPPLVLHLSGLPGPRVDKTSRFIPSASLVAGASTVAVPIRKQPTKPIPHAKRANSLPALDPTPIYLSRAFTPPVRLRNPQHFLLILDLNGTLLNRKRGGKTYHPRPSLPQFLAYCLANHSLLVWSSAVPANVHGVCSALFTPHQRSLLLGEWGRETFGLTSAQYKERVQVYKRLSRVWKNKSIQARHPRAKDGKRWGQRNTVLIDDSLEKARGEPWNIVKVPEFAKQEEEAEEQGEVLAQVVGWLEEARGWSDVSGFAASLGKRFGVGRGWDWNWVERRGPGSDVEVNSDEDGGVKLPMRV